MNRFAPEPDTAYRMLWAGAWRPVLSMWDNGRTTDNPNRCAAAILFIDGNEVAVPVVGGDIYRRKHPHPDDSRNWDVI